jgi:F-type H+-transporting ATPase subunit gamma
MAHVKEHHESNDEFVVAPIGYKAMRFARRSGYALLQEDAIHVRDDIQFIDFKDVSERFMTAYLRGDIDRIVVFYNHFVNTIRQEVRDLQLLPVVNGTTHDEPNDEIRPIYLYEPTPRAVINHLVPMYVENTLYGLILEGKASEHASRMTAMKNATDNAQDIIKTLQLHYNRARQAAITMELTDIIGGANAVN